LDQTNINRVNEHLANIDEVVVRLRESVTVLCKALNHLDDDIESIEIYAGMVKAYMIEEERKEREKNGTSDN